MSTINYVTQKYDTPIKATIWFANPYIPWQDPEVPGGKLGEELTINQDGKCVVRTVVSNGKQSKIIEGRPTEIINIDSKQAEKLLVNILIVLNYLGTSAKKAGRNTAFSLKETNIKFANGSSTTFY